MTLVAKVENGLVVSVSAYDSAAIEVNESQDYIVLPDCIHLNFQIENIDDNGGKIIENNNRKGTTGGIFEIDEDRNSLTYHWHKVMLCIKRINSLLDINPPELLIKNEYRMLQKAVDSLVNFR